jgi:hypothetical protein
MPDEQRPVEEMTDLEIRREKDELRSRIVLDRQPGAPLQPKNSELERFWELDEEQKRQEQDRNTET